MSEQRSSSLSERYWRLPWLARIGLVIVGGLAVLAAIGSIRQNDDGLRGADAPRPAAEVPAAAALPAGQIGPGEWLVGAQVEPGTYRSTGPAEAGDYCMWSRKDAAGAGPMQAVIASDGSYDAQQMLVTIEAEDVVFLTRGCAPFELVG